jgi:hypothetical protein
MNASYFVLGKVGKNISTVPITIYLIINCWISSSNHSLWGTCWFECPLQIMCKSGDLNVMHGSVTTDGQ